MQRTTEKVSHFPLKPPSSVKGVAADRLTEEVFPEIRRRLRFNPIISGLRPPAFSAQQHSKAGKVGIASSNAGLGQLPTFLH
jgi:hypothetical protein